MTTLKGGNEMRSIISEKDMEKRLSEMGYDIFAGVEDDKTVDSVTVVHLAVGLGYEPYLLDGDGMLDQTLVFVEKRDLDVEVKQTAILKCELDQEDSLMSILKNNAVDVISTDYQEDGDVFVVEFDVTGK